MLCLTQKARDKPEPISGFLRHSGQRVFCHSKHVVLLFSFQALRRPGFSSSSWFLHLLTQTSGLLVSPSPPSLLLPSLHFAVSLWLWNPSAERSHCSASLWAAGWQQIRITGAQSAGQGMNTQSFWIPSRSLVGNHLCCFAPAVLCVICTSIKRLSGAARTDHVLQNHRKQQTHPPWCSSVTSSWLGPVY